MDENNSLQFFRLFHIMNTTLQRYTIHTINKIRTKLFAIFFAVFSILKYFAKSKTI